jgi:hypothetical protein
MAMSQSDSWDDSDSVARRRGGTRGGAEKGLPILPDVTSSGQPRCNAPETFKRACADGPWVSTCISR